MGENKKVIQTLTDEELMDLVGGALPSNWDSTILPPSLNPLTLIKPPGAVLVLPFWPR